MRFCEFETSKLWVFWMTQGCLSKKFKNKNKKIKIIIIIYPVL
jgi:hypothetical protein